MKKINKEKIFLFIKKYFALFLLALIPLAFYWQTTSFELSYLDDQNLIGENFSVIKNASIGDIFSSDPFFSEQAFFYRPLLEFSFWLDYHFSGGSWPFFYWHNIFLNSAMAILIFFLFKELGLKKKASWFMAAIFSVQPTLLPAVAWLPGRNDLLLGVFSLAAILSFIQFQKNKQIKTLIFHFFFLLLAIFSKETAILLPLILIFFIPNIFDFKKLKETIKSPLLVAPVLVWLTSVIFYFLFRFGAIGASSMFNLSDLFIGIDSAIKAMFVFFGKFFWPFNLSTLPVNADTSIWPGIIIFITLLLAVWHKRKEVNKKLFFFGLFWFFIFITPSLIFQNNPDYGVAFNLEHRLYLPAVGLLISILSFPKLSPRLAKIIPLTILISALVVSTCRIKDFANADSFWKKAVESSPSSAFAHNNLGAIYYLNNEKDKALNEYLQAQIINPEEKLTYNNIGLCLMDKNYFKEARFYFNQELKINPGCTNALYNLKLLEYRESEKK